MNNIQKAFQNKAKMGLRMAVGGLLPDPNGSDIDAINAEKTARWAEEDAAKQGLRGPAQGYKSYSGASQALAALAQPAVAQPTAQPTQPDAAPETTFEQDLTARQGRIDGLRGKLNGMETAGRANSLMGSNYADGGVVQETPDQLMARMASKYGTTGATPTVQAAPQPAPQPVAQPARPTGMFAGLKAALDPERRMRAAGLAAGGIVRGPGGPTDDKVPMTIGGVDVNLSNKEAVLPVKSVEAFGGPKAVEDFIEQTNGKPPVKSGLRAGGEYGDGTVNWRTPNADMKLPIPAGPPPIEPGAIEGDFTRIPEAGTQVATVEGAGARSIPPTDTVSNVRPVVRPTGQPLPPAASAAEQFGRNAARTHTAMGGANGIAKAGLGVAGKALYNLPAVAAAVDTTGEDAIKVGEFTDGDHGRDLTTAKGWTDSAKQLGLRAGDWGTKGADMLMDLPLAGLNALGAKSDGKPLEYGLLNKTFRQGMRDSNIEGAVIPRSSSEREMDGAEARAESARMHKAHANKDGNMGSVVDQAALDALKAQTATKKTAEANAVGLKAGNQANQNHRFEAVTRGDTAASEAMGDVADKLTGVSRSSNQGLRGMAQRFDAYKNDPSALAARNAQMQLRGDGTRFARKPDSSLEINNSGDFDGSTKMAYTDKNGNPTAIHEGSRENLRGIADAKGLRNQLANMEQMRLERNADENITDVGLRTRSQATLDTQAKNNAALAAKAPNWLDVEKHKLDLAKFDNDKSNVEQLQGNNVRDFRASQSDKVNKRVDQMLDTHVPTAGLKDDDLKVAQARRADMQEAMYSIFGQNMPQDDASLNKSMPQMVEQAKTSLAIRDAIKNRGLWNKISNIGTDPWTTLHGAKIDITGKNIRFANGFTIPVDDVVKDGNAKSADILAALTARTAKQ